MSRECVICLTDEDENTPLLRLPCASHSVCPPSEGSDCLASFFLQAKNEERLYPARCCESVLFIDDYPDLPFDLLWAYQVKEREYSVPAKLRVYCVDTSCTNFLHPNTYEEDAGVTFAKCASCPTITCTRCKAALLLSSDLNSCENEVAGGLNTGRVMTIKCQNEKGKRCGECEEIILIVVAEHKCEIPEAEQRFKITAKEKGYQECQGCGSTVELVEACNHITCECGYDFCYRCGRAWEGFCPFGCPLYGPPEYDEEGYNQDGFHQDTGRNRDGLTPAEQDRENPDDVIDEDSDQEDDEMPPWLGPGAQAVLANLHPEERAEAIEALRIQQIEKGELVFPEEGSQDNEDGGEDEDSEEDEDEDEDFQEDGGLQENENEEQDEEQNGGLPSEDYEHDSDDAQDRGDVDANAANEGVSDGEDAIPAYDDGYGGTDDDDGRRGVDMGIATLYDPLFQNTTDDEDTDDGDTDDEDVYDEDAFDRDAASDAPRLGSDAIDYVNKRMLGDFGDDSNQGVYPGTPLEVNDDEGVASLILENSGSSPLNSPAGAYSSTGSSIRPLNVYRHVFNFNFQPDFYSARPSEPDPADDQDESQAMYSTFSTAAEPIYEDEPEPMDIDSDEEADIYLERSGVPFPMPDPDNGRARHASTNAPMYVPGGWPDDEEL